jgi:hypothetical protein
MFHKMLGNYQVATQFVASRVVLSSIELVILYNLETSLSHYCKKYGLRVS